MAEVKRITVTFGGRVNVGNYSNAEILVTQEVELAPGDNPADVTREAMQRVKVATFEQVEALPSYEAKSWLRAVRPQAKQAAPDDAPNEDDKIPY